VSDERARIEFLIARDGLTAARAWIARTAAIYREALRASDYGSSAAYRRELEDAVREFDAWVEAHAEDPAAATSSAQPGGFTDRISNAPQSPL
jgi:hypothetical protein